MRLLDGNPGAATEIESAETVPDWCRDGLSLVRTVNVLTAPGLGVCAKGGHRTRSSVNYDTARDSARRYRWFAIFLLDSQAWKPVQRAGISSLAQLLDDLHKRRKFFRARGMSAADLDEDGGAVNAEEAREQEDKPCHLVADDVELHDVADDAGPDELAGDAGLQVVADEGPQADSATQPWVI